MRWVAQSAHHHSAPFFFRFGLLFLFLISCFSPRDSVIDACVILSPQVAALLGELSATRTRATQAEAEKVRAVAAAAAAATPLPAAHDDSKRLLGQLAALHEEVVNHLFFFCFFCAAFLYLPSSFLFCSLLNPASQSHSYSLQMSRLRSSHAQVEAEAAALRDEIAKYRFLVFFHIMLPH